MRLEEIFETDYSVRKTVWSKRGDKVVRHDVESRPNTTLPARTKIAVEAKSDAE